MLKKNIVKTLCNKKSKQTPQIGFVSAIYI